MRIFTHPCARLFAGVRVLLAQLLHRSPTNNHFMLDPFRDSQRGIAPSGHARQQLRTSSSTPQITATAIQQQNKSTFFANPLLMILVLMASSLSGCASYFLRKKCESTNWYQHGFDVAMNGKRPAADDFVVACRKAEANVSEQQLDVGFKAGMANYCKPDVAYKIGRNGEPLNFEFCEPSHTKLLTARHLQGLRDYCQPENGFQVGASGKVYGKNCPPDLDKAFAKEYSRGRKKYLQAMVNESHGRIHDIDRKIADKGREIHNLQFQIATLPRPREVIQRNYVNGQYSETKSVEDPHSSRRSQLRWDLDRANGDISTLRNEQEQVRTRMYDYQREMTALE